MLNGMGTEYLGSLASMCRVSLQVWKMPNAPLRDPDAIISFGKIYCVATLSLWEKFQQRMNLGSNFWVKKSVSLFLFLFND